MGFNSGFKGLMRNESNFAKMYGDVEGALESRVADGDGVRPVIC